MTIRSDLAAALQPSLPKAWRIVPHNTDLDVVDRTVVMLHQKSIERAPEAPAGALRVIFSVLVIQPKVEPGTADDSLDEDVADLLLALDKTRAVTWQRADRATWADTNPAWDITVTYYAVSETEE